MSWKYCWRIEIRGWIKGEWLTLGESNFLVKMTHFEAEILWKLQFWRRRRQNFRKTALFRKYQFFLKNDDSMYWQNSLKCLKKNQYVSYFGLLVYIMTTNFRKSLIEKLPNSPFCCISGTNWSKGDIEQNRIIFMVCDVLFTLHTL